MLGILAASRKPYRWQVPMPVLSAEMATNGTMEADANWNNSGSPTTNERSTEQVYAGTYSRKIVADAASEGITQAVSGHANHTWYTCTAMVRGTDAVTLTILLGSMLVTTAAKASNGAWSQVVHAGYSTSASGSVTVRASAATTFYVDNVSVTSMTLASMLNVQTMPRADGYYETGVTLDGATCAGLALRLDSATSPANGLIVLRDQGKVKLLTLASGAYTSTLNVSSTYVPGGKLAARLSGDSVSVYYNGVQIGATQTIAATATNVIHGLCNAWAGNGLTGLEVRRL